jgi:hypothetical protein
MSVLNASTTHSIQRGSSGPNCSNGASAGTAAGAAAAAAGHWLSYLLGPGVHGRLRNARHGRLRSEPPGVGVCLRSFLIGLAEFGDDLLTRLFALNWVGICLCHLRLDDGIVVSKSLLGVLDGCEYIFLSR